MGSLKLLDLPLTLGEYQYMLGVSVYTVCMCVWQREMRGKREIEEEEEEEERGLL